MNKVILMIAAAIMAVGCSSASTEEPVNVNSSEHTESFCIQRVFCKTGYEFCKISCSCVPASCTLTSDGGPVWNPNTCTCN